MKLQAQILDTNYELSVEQDDGRIKAAIDGRIYDLGVTKINDGEYLLFDGSRVYECHVASDHKQSQLFETHVGGHRYEVRLIDPKRLRSGQASGAHKDGVAYIISPMPGKVVRVLVKPGAEVQAGDGIVVVEAMKMQNEMKTPKSGAVVSLSAITGATVNAGEVLAIIE